MKIVRNIILAILAVLVVVLGLGAIFAPKQIEFRVETEIDAPAEVVWQILAHEFGDIADWSETVSESRVLTADEVPAELVADPDAPFPARETVAGPGARVIEVLTEYSEEEMVFTFEGTNLPFILAFAKDKQSVTSISADKSLVAFEVTMEPPAYLRVLNPVLESRFATAFKGVQEELKVYAETGQPLTQ
ncbi:MAG: SRPBCC family protein [Chloroflexota bacterium]